jgi:hypothetical protein
VSGLTRERGANALDADELAADEQISQPQSCADDVLLERACAGRGTRQFGESLPSLSWVRV